MQRNGRSTLPLVFARQALQAFPAGGSGTGLSPRAHRQRREARRETLKCVCSGAAAGAILAELGPDIGMFASHAHCAAWAGLCPGNNESGGRRRRGRARERHPGAGSESPQTPLSLGAAGERSKCAQWWRCFMPKKQLLLDRISRVNCSFTDNV